MSTEPEPADMNNPLKWELVPAEGTDLGVQVYRSMIDGVGWLVMGLNDTDGEFGPVATSVTFVPDPNGMWGR